MCQWFAWNNYDFCPNGQYSDIQHLRHYLLCLPFTPNSLFNQRKGSVVSRSPGAAFLSLIAILYASRSAAVHARIGLDDDGRGLLRKGDDEDEETGGGWYYYSWDCDKDVKNISAFRGGHVTLAAPPPLLPCICWLDLYTGQHLKPVPETGRLGRRGGRRERLLARGPSKEKRRPTARSLTSPVERDDAEPPEH